MLTARETRERIRVDRAVGGYYVAFPLRLQPAKLVKGLAAACVRRGVKIFENSPVIRIADHEVSTASASVDCATVLMCTEGYVHEFPVAGFRPSVIAINSSMIATEPLTSTQWKEIGWSDYELFSDAAHVFTYAQRTDDGRIAIGGRGSPYRWNSRTGGRGVTPKKTIEHLVHRLLEYFPNAGAVSRRARLVGLPRSHPRLVRKRFARPSERARNRLGARGARSHCYASGGENSRREDRARGERVRRHALCESRITPVGTRTPSLGRHQYGVQVASARGPRRRAEREWEDGHARSTGNVTVRGIAALRRRAWGESACLSVRVCC